MHTFPCSINGLQKIREYVIDEIIDEKWIDESHNHGVPLARGNDTLSARNSNKGG
jgi:hypothetical protein